MTLGLSTALSHAPVVAAAGPTSNLLLWSEDLSQAAWMKTNATITQNVAGTADEVVSSPAGGIVRQVTTIAASVGSAATATANMTGVFARFSVSGTFDGQAYTFSVDLEDMGVASTPQLRLRLDIFGGFLRVSLEDAFATDGDYLAARLQLEQAAAFTTYHARGGT